MSASTPFVSLEGQNDMWEDDNSDDLSAEIQPERIRNRSPPFFNRTQIIVGVVFGVLLTVIIALSVLVAQRKEGKETRENLCLTADCIIANYGRWHIR